MGSEYPSHLARGITSPDCIDNGRMKSCVYTFSENTLTGCYEASIQWLYNADSERIIKDQRRPERDSPQFQLGFAVLPRKRLDAVIANPDYGSRVAYCRVPNDIPGSENPYHGHITISPGMERRIRRQLATELVENSKWYCYDSPLPVDGGHRPIPG